MSERRTAVLLLVLAVLAVWVFLVDGVGPEDAGTKDAGETALVDCRAATIEALEVRHGEAAVRGRRAGGRWRADVEPSRQARAEVLLADLAAGLCTMPALDRVPAAASDGEFGFEPGAVELVIEHAGGRSTLVLGRTTPAGNLLYARFAGDPGVLTIGAWFGSAAERVLAAAHLPRKVSPSPAAAQQPLPNGER